MVVWYSTIGMGSIWLLLSACACMKKQQRRLEHVFFIFFLWLVSSDYYFLVPKDLLIPYLKKSYFLVDFVLDSKAQGSSNTLRLRDCPKTIRSNPNPKVRKRIWDFFLTGKNPYFFLTVAFLWNYWTQLHRAPPNKITFNCFLFFMFYWIRENWSYNSCS